MPVLAIEPPLAELAELCRRWQVQELAAFGSLVTGEFDEHSDIDLLISFLPSSCIDLWDMAELRAELVKLLGRDVDLVEKDALRNPFRRKAIMAEQVLLYAA